MTTPSATECTRLDELISRWQRGWQDGKDVPAEDLCREQPELLPQLRAQVEVLRQLGRLAQAVNTPSGGTTQGGNGAPAGSPAREDLCPPKFDFLAPPQQPDEVGRLGSYRVLKVLGSGGMGLVLLAEDLLLKRPVALKVMRPELAADKTGRQRFLREAQATAAIDHHHIVAIHQVAEENGVPFIVMPLLRGETLEARLQREQHLPIPHAVMIGKQIAADLAVAHKHGLVHRDVKPANIWLEEDTGWVKILDFGLARPLTDNVHLTQSGTLMGTPAYMAPEQARGAPLDHRCDLFSLGVVLYRLATGLLPFSGDSVMAVLTALAVDQPEPPHRLNGGVPVELSDLIMQLLAKDPAQRPASARVVADRLQRLANQLGSPRLEPEQTAGLPASADPGLGLAQSIQATQPVPAAPASGKKAPGRPVAIAAAMGALALLVAGVVFFLQTPKGTVRIEINDDSIEATLTKNGAVIKGVDKTHNITVAAGEQGLKIKRGDLEFETDRFVLKKGETIRLKIELLPGKVQVVRDGKVIGEKPLRIPLVRNDRTAAEWALGLGGTVTINDGKDREISAAKDLPADPWTLRRINLTNNKQVDNAGLKELAGLKSLNFLNLAGASVTDLGLKELAGLKNLGDLRLEGSKVTDAGLKHLTGHQNLGILFLGGTKVTGAGLKELAGLKSLYMLNLNGTPLTDAGLKELARLKGLQSLSLTSTPLTDASLKELAPMKSLTQLWLSGTKVTDAGLVHLQGLTNLKSLDLTKTQVTVKGVVALRKSLPDCQITSELTPAGSDHRAAKWALELGGRVFIDDGKEREIRAAKDLPAGTWSLKSLGLHQIKVTDAGLKELHGLKNLGDLTLSFTQITDAGLKELAGLQNLTHLTLGGNPQITGAGLKELAALKNLCFLYLNGTNVTDAGLKDLASLQSLHTLDLGGTNVTDAGLKDLAGLQNLHTLDLGGTKITDAGMKDLASIKSLRGLSLQRTQVTGVGLKDLAKHKRLSGLSLGSTKLTDADLKELAGLKSLHSLSLSDTQVTGAGLKDLAGIKSLQMLDLSCTKGTDASLKVLSSLKSLQNLSLSDTAVTDVGLVHLEGLTNLKTLDLTKTEVTEKGIAALRKALPDCQITSE